MDRRGERSHKPTLATEVEYVDLVGEPDRRFGDYVPARRAIGFVAAAAAASELIGKIDALSAGADHPKPPHRTNNEWPEDEILQLAA